MMTHRYNSGGLIGGTILIALGLLFLLGQFLNFRAWDLMWPFFVIGIGGLFFVGMLAGGKSTAGLAIPGSIIAVIGLMLLVQNLTGAWSSWAYGWTIILAAVGLGIWIAGLWGDNPAMRRSGLKVMEIGFILFVIFGAFFELVIFGNGSSALRQAFFPVLLIVVGLYLLARRSGLWPQSWQPSWRHEAAQDKPADDRPTPPPQA